MFLFSESLKLNLILKALGKLYPKLTFASSPIGTLNALGYNSFRNILSYPNNSLI